MARNAPGNGSYVMSLLPVTLLNSAWSKLGQQRSWIARSHAPIKSHPDASFYCHDGPWMWLCCRASPATLHVDCKNPVALPRKARGHHGGIPSPKSIVRSRHQDRTPAILRGIIVDVSVVGPAQELGHGTLSKGRSGRIKLTHSRRARGPDSHIDACVSTRPVPPSATEAGRLLQPYR